MNASGDLKSKAVKEGVHCKSNQTAKNVKNNNLMLQMLQVDTLTVYQLYTLVNFSRKSQKQYTVSFVLRINLNVRCNHT